MIDKEDLWTALSTRKIYTTEHLVIPPDFNGTCSNDYVSMDTPLLQAITGLRYHNGGHYINGFRIYGNPKTLAEISELSVMSMFTFSLYINSTFSDGTLHIYQTNGNEFIEVKYKHAF